MSRIPTCWPRPPKSLALSRTNAPRAARPVAGHELGEAGDLVTLPRPSRPGIILDGPILGQLPSETKRPIYSGSLTTVPRSVWIIPRVHACGRAKTADPIELAKLRQETRSDLQKLPLPPLNLRNSCCVIRKMPMRCAVSWASSNISPPRRTSFAICSAAPICSTSRLPCSATPTIPTRRFSAKNLQDQRENAIKLALGPQRYEEYRLLHDPVYRDAHGDCA